MLYILREGSTYMKVINTKDTSDVHTIELGDMYKAGTHIAPGLNENLDAETVRFHVNTPFVYNQIFDYHFDTKKGKQADAHPPYHHSIHMHIHHS